MNDERVPLRTLVLGDWRFRYTRRLVGVYRPRPFFCANVRWVGGRAWTSLKSEVPVGDKSFEIRVRHLGPVSLEVAWT